MKIEGKNIEMGDFGDDWGNYIPNESCTVSFSGKFDSYNFESFVEALRPTTNKFKLHIDDYLHYEMDGNFKQQEILPDGSITVTIQGDLVKAIFTTIKKQFRMHPQGRNPICWTIERMFG